MVNYFCTDSVEEQVDYLTDKITDLNTKKLDKAAIVQTTGTGTDVVMSQKAVTDAIASADPTAEKLYEVIKGTSTVTVDLSQDQQTLNVALDKSQEVQYVELTPASATQGTLTDTQWTTLQLNKGNCIILNNEIYRLADNQNTDGILSYVHTGWDGTARKDKSINITVSTKAWTLVVAESGGKLYKHYINGYNSSGNTAEIILYNSNQDKLVDPSNNSYIKYSNTFVRGYVSLMDASSGSIVTKSYTISRLGSGNQKTTVIYLKDNIETIFDCSFSNDNVTDI